ncbi:uncharacterized protein G6M90_00g069550 [Metarhizium brunneum]|uniref:Uncharacterized protein n=1 Tax=Metarhizium brunneum TaxID=500148 RepID=A0A7D5UYS7_9HYPO|nr:hypothetical protein G6M90_00g069550 [Metarhizium brunneum]
MTAKVMTVNDGSQMPAMAYGVGTAHLSKFRQIFGLPDFDSVQLIVEALNMGYRHIDTAQRDLHRLKGYLDDLDKFWLTEEDIEDIRQLGLQQKVSNFLQMGVGREYETGLVEPSPSWGFNTPKNMMTTVKNVAIVLST